MANKFYKYTHDTPCAVSLNGVPSVHMHAGNTYSLPDDNKFVQSLLKQGRLEMVVETAKAAKPTPDQPTNEK